MTTAKKVFSVLLGLMAFYSTISGVIFLISNIQGIRVPDGHPIDPWWLVVVLLVVIPVITGISSILLYPKKKDNEKTRG